MLLRVFALTFSSQNLSHPRKVNVPTYHGFFSCLGNSYRGAFGNATSRRDARYSLPVPTVIVRARSVIEESSFDVKNAHITLSKLLQNCAITFKPDAITASVIATTRVEHALGSNRIAHGFTMEKTVMNTLRKLTVIALGVVSAILFAAQASAAAAAKG